ncbi:hypothetical protein OBA40_08710 [Alphaproteobacteria bacterium]|nr:hypothetical protein [Alphaproteobacteria bacterium]
MKFLSIICSFLLIMPSIINAHGSRTDIKGCYNNSKTGIYNCHDGSSFNNGRLNENYYNPLLGSLISGLTEVSYSYLYLSQKKEWGI